jgi:hypothetical protein
MSWVPENLSELTDWRQPIAIKEFAQRVETEENGVILEKCWLGNEVPHRIRCGRCGRELSVRPKNIRSGQRACKYCSRGVDASETKFYANVTSQGATVEPGQEWRGVRVKYHVVCKAGHDCYPRADSIIQGCGVCNRCGHGVNTSEAKFNAGVASQGAIAEPGQEWRGCRAKYHVICKAGHDCHPRADDVIQGQGVCGRCGKGVDASEAKFYAGVASQGATVKPGQEWRGALAKYRVVCKAGHDCYPQASSIISGVGVCGRCGKGVDASEAKFYAGVASQGATVKPGQEWRGCMAKYHVICKAGHDCYPWASNVISGVGVCGQCYVIHDVFYVVTTSAGNCKFGITSGDPKDRLRNHAYWGYRHVEFVVTGLPIGVARAAENAIKSALWDAGFVPEYGWEYFLSTAKDLVLKLAHEYLDQYAAKEAA